MKGVWRAWRLLEMRTTVGSWEMVPRWKSDRLPPAQRNYSSGSQSGVPGQPHPITWGWLDIQRIRPHPDILNQKPGVGSSMLLEQAPQLILIPD